MSSMQANIEQKLQRLVPTFLSVINESHNHSVPPNSETHFKVTLVSDQFDGLAAVRRHQQVYAVLAEPLANGVHALALHTYTPLEWGLRQEASPESPDCLGGSR